MKVTDFSVLDGNGDGLPAHPHGNNIAFACRGCGHPVLAVALPNQLGWDEEHPTECKRCSARYFLRLYEDTRQAWIFDAQ